MNYEKNQGKVKQIEREVEGKKCYLAIVVRKALHDEVTFEQRYER